MYSITALEEGIRNGAISIDLRGHSERRGIPQFAEGAIKSYRERLLDHIELLKKFYFLDSRENLSDEQRAWRIREAERFSSNNGFELGEPLFFSGVYHYCRNCGKEPSPYLKDADTISLFEWADEGISPSSCPLAGGPKPCKTIIEVPSGELVFANFFRGVDDEPEGREYSAGWDLNSVLGRQNIANHLASHGFGYGQMGNTSVTVYNSPDKDHLVLFNPDPEYVREEVEYRQEEDEVIPHSLQARLDELISFEEKGFQEVGRVRCEMWRWMCADKVTLQKSGARESDNYEPFTVKVKPGKWEITHYYDLSGGDTMIASEMRLVAKE